MAYAYDVDELLDDAVVSLVTRNEKGVLESRVVKGTAHAYTHSLADAVYGQASRPAPDSYSLAVTARIAALMQRQPRDRTGSFSASSAGVCDRRRQFEAVGLPPSYDGPIDPHLAAIFDDGKWRHLRWQANLMELGLLDYVELSAESDALLTKGSMDGWVKSGFVGHLAGEPFILEVKGVSHFTKPSMLNDHPIPKGEHLSQGLSYCALLKGTEYATNNVVFLYDNKNNQGVMEWAVSFADHVIELRQEDMARLGDKTKAGELEPMLKECQMKSGQWLSCPFGTLRRAGTCPQQKSISLPAKSSKKVLRKPRP